MSVAGEIGGAAFAAIVRAALDAIVVADEDGRVIEFNPAAERISNGAGEALGARSGHAIGPPTWPSQMRGLGRIRSGDPRALEQSWRDRDQAIAVNGTVFSPALSRSRAPTCQAKAVSQPVSGSVRTRESNGQPSGTVEQLLRGSCDQTEVIFELMSRHAIVLQLPPAGLRPWRADAIWGAIGRHVNPAYKCGFSRIRTLDVEAPGPGR